MSCGTSDVYYEQNPGNPTGVYEPLAGDELIVDNVTFSGSADECGAITGQRVTIRIPILCKAVWLTDCECKVVLSGAINQIDTFGLSRDALGNKVLVKKRFRDLAKMWHPDKIDRKAMIGIRHYYQDDKIEPDDMMVKVNLAYEKIKKMKPEKLSVKAAQNLMKDLGDMFGGKRPDWANLDPKKGVYA